MGAPSEDKLLVVQGGTGTGKTTFLRALMGALGDYARAASFDAFAARKYPNGLHPEIVALRGARLVVVAEVERGQRFAESLLKQLTGGDVISARGLYQGPVEFRASFTLWIKTNHRPGLADDDDALWRRVREIPFTQVPAHPDPNLRATLSNDPACKRAILAWMVEGCLAWQREGLGEPPAVTAATAAYRAEMDPLAGWLADCCLLAPAAWTSSQPLRSSYEHWCREQGVEPIGADAFFKRLSRRGLRRADRGRTHVRGWQGIGLLAAVPPGK